MRHGQLLHRLSLKFNSSEINQLFGVRQGLFFCCLRKASCFFVLLRLLFLCGCFFFKVRRIGFFPTTVNSQAFTDIWERGESQGGFLITITYFVLLDYYYLVI